MKLLVALALSMLALYIGLYLDSAWLVWALCPVVGLLGAAMISTRLGWLRGAKAE